MPYRERRAKIPSTIQLLAFVFPKALPEAMAAALKTSNPQFIFLLVSFQVRTPILGIKSKEAPKRATTAALIPVHLSVTHRRTVIQKIPRT